MMLRAVPWLLTFRDVPELLTLRDELELPTELLRVLAGAGAGDRLRVVLEPLLTLLRLVLEAAPLFRLRLEPVLLGRS